MLPFLTDRLDSELRKTGDKVTYRTYPTSLTWPW